MQKKQKFRTHVSLDGLCRLTRVNPITRRQILHSSKQKEFADDNFKFDANGRKLSKQQILNSSKLQTTILNLMEIAESSLKGVEKHCG